MPLSIDFMLLIVSTIGLAVIVAMIYFYSDKNHGNINDMNDNIDRVFPVPGGSAIIPSLPCIT